MIKKKKTISYVVELKPIGWNIFWDRWDSFKSIKEAKSAVTKHRKHMICFHSQRKNLIMYRITKHVVNQTFESKVVYENRR